MQNPLKSIGNIAKLKQQAKQMQDELAAEEIVVEEGDIYVVITGGQEVKQFSVQGVSSDEAIRVLNKAIKKSQESAAKKLQGMMGGMGGMSGLMGGN